MEGRSPGQAFGALIFTCNGRGRNLFGEPHYDSRKLAEFIPVPSSGFLCNGRLLKSHQTSLASFLCHLSFNNIQVLRVPALLFIAALLAVPVTIYSKMYTKDTMQQMLRHFTRDWYMQVK